MRRQNAWPRQPPSAVRDMSAGAGGRFMRRGGERPGSALLAGRVAKRVSGRALHLRQLVGGHLLGLVLVGLRLLLFLGNPHLTFSHDDLLGLLDWRILYGARPPARGSAH